MRKINKTTKKMRDRCKALTLKDKKCKRNAAANSLYCYQHEKHKKGTIIGIKDLPRKAQTIVLKNPTKKDSKGHIYVYYVNSDHKEPNSYWKIGRTTQTVDKRLSQWPNSILKKSYEVKYNKMAERLIHIIMDKQRIYRYAYNSGKHETAQRFHSIYKHDGSLVEDSQNRQKDIDEGDFKLQGIKKHIEWFICDWKFAKNIIESVVNHVNKINV